MEKSTNLHATILSGQSVNVPAPKVGEALTVQSSPAGNLNILFDISTASPEREDNDLVLNSEGGTVVIAGFFEVGDESLPTLTLEDGTLVDATEFFAGSGLDLTTAAGEAGSVESSGTKYSDDAGSLFLGVDRLAVLDSEAASARGTENLGFVGSADLTGSDITLPSDISDPTLPPDPEEEIFPYPIDYDMRAILYHPSGSSSDDLRLNLWDIFIETNLSNLEAGLAIKHPEHAKEYFTFDLDNPFDTNGFLVFTLSEEGKNKLQNSGGASIYDYISIVINGEEHTIQVVANGDGLFNSSFEHPSGNLAENGLVVGEWHQGQDSIKDFNGQNINTSSQSDSLYLEGNITNLNINTNEGNDRFYLTGNLADSTFDMGEGPARVWIEGNVTDSSFTMGDGTSDFYVKSGDVQSGKVESSKIIMGEGNDIFTAEGGVKGSLIKMGAGFDAFSVQGEGLVDSEIHMGEGGDAVNIYGGVVNSKIYMGDDDDGLGIYDGMEESFAYMGEGVDVASLGGVFTNSLIDMGAGDDTVYVDYDSFESTGTTCDGGEGDDILNLRSLKDVNLSEVLDVFKGFETIDFFGKGSGVLNIDSLIGKTEKTLMIKGNEGHGKVSLSEGWISTEETQVHDYVTYGVYRHGEDDDAAHILIQLSLIGSVG